MNTPAIPITVVIVDDDPDVRRSLEDILDRHTSTCCIGSFASAEDAIEEIPRIKPRLALIDINLPCLNGVECVRLLAPQAPQTQFVMLTVYDDDEDVFNSLAAGAIGYLLKPVRAVELVSAIEEVHAGGAPMSTKIARRVVQAFKKPVSPESQAPNLSAREREVVGLLAQGYQSKEIATKLGVSYWTIESHVIHIYQKLHVRSRAEAVAKYLGK